MINDGLEVSRNSPILRLFFIFSCFSFWGIQYSVWFQGIQYSVQGIQYSVQGLIFLFQGIQYSVWFSILRLILSCIPIFSLTKYEPQITMAESAPKYILLWREIHTAWNTYYYGGIHTTMVKYIHLHIDHHGVKYILHPNRRRSPWWNWNTYAD